MLSFSKTLFSAVITAALFSAAVPVTAQKPELREMNGVQRLIYHGNPFIMLAGELHNSTSSTIDYLAPAMAGAKNMGLNSVIVTAEWDLIEPEKGKFDFSSVDNIISEAENNDLPVVIAWFGTWKNGGSSYVPSWMKRDTKTYFRAKDENGENTDVISPFCMAAMEADSKAFAALMGYIKERDKSNYVLFMQVENEVGLWKQSIDYCQTAQKVYSKTVSPALIDFLKGSSATGVMKEKWTANGSKTSGTWKEVFGDNAYTEAFFMQWAYASYIEEVAKAGKAEYNIPMYMNTVAMPPSGFSFNAGAGVPVADKKEKDGYEDPLIKKGSPFGGTSPLFPSGAPVWQAIDMYHLFCPSVDFFSPDIYVPAFKAVSDAYTRVDNPLFVPETGRDASPAFYALAQNNAIGFSPFAIEDAYLNKDLRGVYATLGELLPVISEYQGTGKMKGFLRENDETSTSFELGNYRIEVSYIPGESHAYGLIIQTGEEEFTISGVGCLVKIFSKDEKVNTRFEYISEGRFEDGKWHGEVWLNGDQTGHGTEVYLRGRVTYADEFTPLEGEVYPRHNVASSETRQELVTGRQKSPSIYKVKTYNYNK